MDERVEAMNWLIVGLGVPAAPDEIFFESLGIVGPSARRTANSFTSFEQPSARGSL
jgi:hypothetical protein